MKKKALVNKVNELISSNIKYFLLYLIVGGLATIVEWVIFYFVNLSDKINYMVATAIAFFFSTFANWLFGKLILFRQSEQTILSELGKIYLTSISGLIFNLTIMYIAVNILNLNEMFSKIIATGIVFFWNFVIRKFVIYRR